MKLDQPLTFPQAAREIRWAPDADGRYRYAGRRLLRLVLRREREIGRRIAIRDRAGRPIQVTLGAITRYMPELRPSRIDTLAATLRPLLIEVERRAREIVDDRIEERVEPELQKLHNRDEEIANHVAQIANIVRSLCPTAEMPPKDPSARNHAEPRGPTLVPPADRSRCSPSTPSPSPENAASQPSRNGADVTA